MLKLVSSTWQGWGANQSYSLTHSLLKGKYVVSLGVAVLIITERYSSCSISKCGININSYVLLSCVKVILWLSWQSSQGGKPIGCFPTYLASKRREKRGYFASFVKIRKKKKKLASQLNTSTKWSITEMCIHRATCTVGTHALVSNLLAVEASLAFVSKAILNFYFIFGET